MEGGAEKEEKDPREILGTMADYNETLEDPAEEEVQ